ncbi:hypothetical protein ACFLY6_02400, partial [Candidatus Dependentiae bacterium]
MRTLNYSTLFFLLIINSISVLTREGKIPPTSIEDIKNIWNLSIARNVDIAAPGWFKEHGTQYFGVKNMILALPRNNHATVTKKGEDKAKTYISTKKVMKAMKELLLLACLHRLEETLGLSGKEKKEEVAESKEDGGWTKTRENPLETWKSQIKKGTNPTKKYHTSGADTFLTNKGILLKVNFKKNKVWMYRKGRTFGITKFHPLSDPIEIYAALHILDDITFQNPTNVFLPSEY